MDIDHWRRLRELAEACAALPEAERRSWLASNVSDPELRERVASLVDEPGEPEDDTDEPWREAVNSLTTGTSTIDRTLGSWKLTERIGDGGMGTVFLAERVDGGFTQRAAIKCLQRANLTTEFIARFESERQILARLEHPAVARLLDGGRDASGEPWLAMEYVEGETLTAYCDSRNHDLGARLQLFRRICGAVSHAHGHLIVHRDLKPSNVLVSHDGEVKLLDFGVAKLLDAADDGFLTGTAAAPMTPAYAAPEQLRGEPANTAMDVYSLGVMLYELLSGVLPYRTTGTSSAELAAAVLNSRPVPASTAFQQHSTDATQRRRIATSRDQSPASLRRALSGDLDAILMKAMRVDPAHRYQSVQALDADIALHLAHHPVKARRGNWRYRSGLFLRRHALSSALASLLIAGLVAGLLNARHQASLVAEQRDLARTEAQRSNEALAFLQETFRLADPSRNQGRQLSAKELLLLGQKRLLEEDEGQPENAALDAWLMEELAETEQGLGLLSEPMELLNEAARLYQQSGMPIDSGRAQVQAAWLLTRLGSNQEAEDAAQRALDTLGSSADQADMADSATLAQAYHVLGMAKGNRGDKEGALELLRRSREYWQVAGTPIHLGPSTTATVLGYFLGSAGFADESESLLRETAQQLKAVGEDGDLDRAEINGTLGIRMRRVGRFEEARELDESAVEIAERLLGRDHPFYWTATGNLGAVYTNLGEHERGVEAQRERLDYRRRTMGERSTRLGLTWRHYAAALLEAGNVEQAIAAAQTTRSMYSKSDPEALEAYLGLDLLDARLQLASGHHAEAEDQVHTALAKWEQFERNDPRAAATAYLILFQTALETGRDDEACDRMDEAVLWADRSGTSLNIEFAERIMLSEKICQLMKPEVDTRTNPDPLEQLSTASALSRDPSVVRLLQYARALYASRNVSNPDNRNSAGASDK